MIVTTTSPNNHVLTSRSVPVISGDEAVSIILALEKEMEKLGSHSCIGLAAPQIGISKQVAIIRHAGVCINLINPTILGGHTQIISQNEGCISLPNRLFDVPRFSIVKIKNHLLWTSAAGTMAIEEDINRRPINRNSIPVGMQLVPVESVYVYDNHAEDCGGIICVAVQHEIDHLSGITLDKKPQTVEKTVAGTAMIGRNDLCYCGSGKKYKKCCLSKIN